MRENLKKNQAITLVSLVVTIIILIILAGVSINLTLGKNGIITIAKQAKENTELTKIEEETALNELYGELENESSSGISYDAIAKLVEFKREIASAISDMGVTTLENADASTMATNIRSISGASSADKVSYDNTNSGLEATNVQGAIDEVNHTLADLIIVDSITTEDYTITGTAVKSLSIDMPIHEGYKLSLVVPCVTQASSESSRVGVACVTTISINENTVSYKLKNISSNDTKFAVIFTGLYIKQW